MVKAYNFLASWQLFPEKCSYEYGQTPKSGICRIETLPDESALLMNINWVTQLNEAFVTAYKFIPDAQTYEFESKDVADEITAEISNSYNMKIELLKNKTVLLSAAYKILPNGYLEITQNGELANGKKYVNVEVYHKQMSVLPYASGVSGAVIRPTKEGVIRHQALTAMNEQTDMQLNQIREQIELLARQAQQIIRRKEVSMKFYEAKLNFKPLIGHEYHLYQNHDNSYLLSMVSPKEWGSSGPFKEFVASAKLLADHTWVEL